MTSFYVYLNFDGNCDEAFEFYKDVFGGEYDARMTYSDAPPDFKFDEADAGKIMHVTLSVGGGLLMGSDIAKGYGEAPTPSNAFSISAKVEAREEADAVFSKLKEGGVETMPMQETFWGSYFGRCTDKFGISWMVSVNL